jgi:hypothetical protein
VAAAPALATDSLHGANAATPPPPPSVPPPGLNVNSDHIRCSPGTGTSSSSSAAVAAPSGAACAADGMSTMAPVQPYTDMAAAAAEGAAAAAKEVEEVDDEEAQLQSGGWITADSTGAHGRVMMVVSRPAKASKVASPRVDGDGMLTVGPLRGSGTVHGGARLAVVCPHGAKGQDALRLAVPG